MLIYLLIISGFISTSGGIFPLGSPKGYHHPERHTFEVMRLITHWLQSPEISEFGKNNEVLHFSSFETDHSTEQSPVHELHRSWLSNTAFTWTSKDVTAWLNGEVGLPEYVPLFRRERINGSMLPRLIHPTEPLLEMSWYRDQSDFRWLRAKIIELIVYGPSGTIQGLSVAVCTFGLLLLLVATSCSVYTTARLRRNRIVAERSVACQRSEAVGIRVVNRLRRLEAIRETLFSKGFVSDLYSRDQTCEAPTDQQAATVAEMQKSPTRRHLLLAHNLELARLLGDTFQREHSLLRQQLLSCQTTLDYLKETTDGFSLFWSLNSTNFHKIMKENDLRLRSLQSSLVEVTSRWNTVGFLFRSLSSAASGEPSPCLTDKSALSTEGDDALVKVTFGNRLNSVLSFDQPGQVAPKRIVFVNRNNSSALARGDETSVVNTSAGPTRNSDSVVPIDAGITVQGEALTPTILEAATETSPPQPIPNGNSGNGQRLPFDKTTVHSPDLPTGDHPTPVSDFSTSKIPQPSSTAKHQGMHLPRPKSSQLSTPVELKSKIPKIHAVRTTDRWSTFENRQQQFAQEPSQQTPISSVCAATTTSTVSRYSSQERLPRRQANGGVSTGRCVDTNY